MGRKTPEPVKQPKPKKTPDDKRLISFRIAHAVADPDAARPQPKEDGEDACVEDGEQAPPQAGEERRRSTASGGGEKLARLAIVTYPVDINTRTSYSRRRGATSARAIASGATNDGVVAAALSTVVPWPLSVASSHANPSPGTACRSGSQ